MAEKSDKKEEIIIKKIIKGGGGHHGGAWKVAYADFVTAMMAFFLLLWLLSTTTPEQRQGIAEYFTPTTGLKDAKGIGFNGGMTPNDPGTSKTSLSQPGLVPGQVSQGPIPQEPTPVKDMAPPQETNGQATGMAMNSNAEKKDEEQSASQTSNSSEDEQQLNKAKEDILSSFDNTPDLQRYRKNVIVTNTPEGLRIDLVDDEQNAMFMQGTPEMTDMGRTMLRAVGGVILRTTNHAEITGHTESMVYPPGASYTNWELSGDRANTARRFLSQNVVEPNRILRVAGMGDRDLLLPKEPKSPRNRRISILLMRNSHMAAREAAPTERSLLSVPNMEGPAVQAPEPVEKK